MKINKYYFSFLNLKRVKYDLIIKNYFAYANNNTNSLKNK